MASDAAARVEVPGGRLPFPLQDGERVLQLCRRHWFYLWPATIIMTAIALGGVIIAGVLLAMIDQFDGIARTIFFIAALIWLLYWAVRIFLNWYRYHNDIWVITNQRIVDSYRPSPFRHTLSTADLVNVQDMTVEKNGILASMFNFGDVVCQTAGDGRRDFRMTGIPDPQSVQLLMDRERDRERTRGR
jgi:hypothetical protein